MDTPTTMIGMVTMAAAPVYAVTRRGQIYEAVDHYALEPVVGDPVLIDYIEDTTQWVIVAIIT